ncbi:MAG: lysophospholipid acyltransferase family protein [Candidatus Eisenbacteria bacterium]
MSSLGILSRATAACDPAILGGLAAVVDRAAFRSSARRADIWRANLEWLAIPPPAADPGAPRHARPPRLLANHLSMHAETLAMLAGRRFDLAIAGEEHLRRALEIAATGNGAGTASRAATGNDAGTANRAATGSRTGDVHGDAARGGLVLATAHVGNWNLGALLVAEIAGRPVHSVAGVQILPAWTAPLRRAYRRLGIRVHPGGTDARRLLAILRRGGIVGLHLDGDQHRGPSLASRGVALLALRSRSPILPGVCHRLPRGRFLARFLPPIVPARPGERPDLDGLQRRIEEAFRAIVASAPEQWILFRPLGPPPAAPAPERSCAS